MPLVFLAIASSPYAVNPYRRWLVPGGLTAWLVSGARAAANPLPYLRVRRADRPAINWDELTRGQDR